MFEKPKSALNAMLARIITHSEALHEELHEFEDELSHHVSHLLKKIAKLTAYAELETPDKHAPEAVSLITRNMAEIQDDLTDLLDDAGADPAIYAVGETISKLVALMTAEWGSPVSSSTGAIPEAGGPREALRILEHQLEKMVPTARADIAVRHAYLALREMAKFWRANDDQLADLTPEHAHEHEHENQDKGKSKEGHHHHGDESGHQHSHDDI